MMKKETKTILLVSMLNFLLWSSMSFLLPIEAIFLHTFVESSTIKGLILSIPSLVLITLSPIFVKISEKYGRKKVMLILILLSAPFFSILPFSTSYQMYAFFKFLSSTLFLISPIILVYLSKIVKRLGVGYGSTILASSVGGSFGSLFSGMVGELFGLKFSYILTSIFLFFSTLTLLPLEEIKNKIEKKTKIKKRLKFNFRTIDLILISVLINSFVFSLHFSARGLVWPLVVEKISDNPVLFTGIIFSLMGIVATVLAIPSGILAEKFGEKKLLFLGWFLMGIFGVSIYFSTENLYLFSLLSILYSIGEVLKGPASSMILAKYKKSIYFGYSTSFGSVGSIIGPALSGVLMDLFGTKLTVLSLGIIILLPLILISIGLFIKTRQK